MNKSKRMLLVLILTLTALLVSQCRLPERRSRDFSVWVTTPFDGAVVGVGDSVSISTHLVDWLDDFDTTRIHNVTFFANGLKVGEAQFTFNPDNVSDGVTFEWMPDTPGEYSIQALTSRRGNWSISNTRQICVVDFSILSTGLREDGHYWGSHGYEGECDIPPRSASAMPGTLTFMATASPDPLEYYPGTWEPSRGAYIYYTGEGYPMLPEGCEDKRHIEIDFRATAGDPNDDIAFVKVDLSIDYTDFIRSQTIILNQESGTSLDAKVFTGDAVSYHLFPTSTINPTFQATWSAFALDRSGVVIASVGPNTIPINTCYLVEMAPMSAPAPTNFIGTIPEVIQCYWGPGQPYTLVSSLKAGIKVQIIGVGIQNGWLVVENPIYEGIPCWVKESAVDLPPEILLSDLPIIDIPPTFGPRGSGDSEGGGTGGEGGGETGCNLSIPICSSQGLSFDSTNCACVPLE